MVKLTKEHLKRIIREAHGGEAAFPLTGGEKFPLTQGRGKESAARRPSHAGYFGISDAQDAAQYHGTPQYAGYVAALSAEEAIEKWEPGTNGKWVAQEIDNKEFHRQLKQVEADLQRLKKKRDEMMSAFGDKVALDRGVQPKRR